MIIKKEYTCPKCGSRIAIHIQYVDASDSSSKKFIKGRYELYNPCGHVDKKMINKLYNEAEQTIYK